MLAKAGAQIADAQALGCRAGCGPQRPGAGVLGRNCAAQLLLFAGTEGGGHGAEGQAEPLALVRVPAELPEYLAVACPARPVAGAQVLVLADQEQQARFRPGGGAAAAVQTVKGALPQCGVELPQALEVAHAVVEAGIGRGGHCRTQHRLGIAGLALQHGVQSCQRSVVMPLADLDVGQILPGQRAIGMVPDEFAVITGRFPELHLAGKQSGTIVPCRILLRMRGEDAAVLANGLIRPAGVLEYHGQVEAHLGILVPGQESTQQFLGAGLPAQPGQQRTRCRRRPGMAVILLQGLREMPDGLRNLVQCVSTHAEQEVLLGVCARVGLQQRAGICRPLLLQEADGLLPGRRQGMGPVERAPRSKIAAPLMVLAKLLIW